MKDKKLKKEIEEEVGKLDSKEIREKIERNKEFNKIGDKETWKRNDYTYKEIIGEFSHDLLIYSTALIILVLIFMGSLGNFYNIPTGDYITNSTKQIVMVSNIVLRSFYDGGYLNPILTTVLFYLVIAMMFVAPTAVLIYRIIKKNKEVNNGRRERKSKGEIFSGRSSNSDSDSNKR
jgi:hypothetical protein